MRIRTMSISGTFVLVVPDTECFIYLLGFEFHMQSSEIALWITYELVHINQEPKMTCL